MLRSFRAVPLATALAALALPAAAGAATMTTAAGPPLAKPPAGTPPYADVPQFFPARTVVRVGDSVRWKFFGFHSIYFAKGRGGSPPLVTVDPTRTYTESDPAGSPFWFNGQPQFVASPAAVLPLGTKTETGRAPNGSGLPRGPKFTYKLKFTKAGTFTYYCTIHPGMKGTVKVLPRRVGRVPSTRTVEQSVKRQLARGIAEVKKHDRRASAAGNVVEAGRDTNATSLLAFFPAEKTVPVGTTVDFRMSAKTNEIHTVTFGSAAVLGKGGYGEQLGSALFSPLPGTGKNGPPVLGIPGALFFPSDPGPLTLDGSGHGGFLNTGLLGEKPLPRDQKVTFTKPGIYRYICLVHPDMQGQIIVK